MGRILRSIVRPAVLVPVAIILLATGIGAYAVRDRRTPPTAPAAAPLVELGDQSIPKPDHSRPTPTPTPTPPPATKPAPKPVAPVTPAAKGPNLKVFKKLGAWIDLYDYEVVVPETASADMAARGVKTVYLQTGRWNKPGPDDSRVFMNTAIVERWVHAVHANKMKIVGWYLPAYENMGRDVTRTKAIALYRTSAGQRFDGLMIDVEYKNQMPSLSAWNAAVAEHARRVRSKVGDLYPVAVAVPAPLAMEIYPHLWVGFPWHSLAESADVFMPMSYWSFRHDCDEKPQHCAYGYTAGNIERVRALTGKPNIPVHIIGGVGDGIATEEVVDFVKAARALNAYGASLYDYVTTKPEYWAPLADLNG